MLSLCQLSLCCALHAHQQHATIGGREVLTNHENMSRACCESKMSTGVIPNLLLV